MGIELNAHEQLVCETRFLTFTPWWNTPENFYLFQAHDVFRFLSIEQRAGSCERHKSKNKDKKLKFRQYFIINDYASS